LFGEWSQDVVQLLKLAAGNLAARWAALNGLSAEDALQACTWDLKRRWSLTALRANARISRGQDRVRVPREVLGRGLAWLAGLAARPSLGGWDSRWLARPPASVLIGVRL